ncbi:histidine kinase [Streptomyces sp. NRRL S-1022]|uniref:histidine kinase n=1 Tax=Streptomyces sp. NRRL S-1022 TaxID=1463880 RepID=UPI0004C03897|nr:histidine kinase dimerization/phosphoacceptor domain-containing protein [Streptomyces sp. NRRL S-1022]
MHDIVTHNLSVMVALAGSAPYARSADTSSAALRQISGTGRRALTDLRRSLDLLRTDEPDAQRHPLPGMAELAAFDEQMRHAGLPTRLKTRGDPAPAPVAAQLTVYRLVIRRAMGDGTAFHAPDDLDRVLRGASRNLTASGLGDAHCVDDPVPVVPAGVTEAHAGRGCAGGDLEGDGLGA